MNNILNQIIFNKDVANNGGQNFIYNSEDFSNNSWTKTNTTVVSNTEIAPDGKRTASRLIETTANGTHALVQASPAYSFISGLTYTQSVFVKKGIGTLASNFIQLPNSGSAFSTSKFANFDISIGIVTSSIGVFANIIPFKNGWYRISITSTATTTSTTTSHPIFIIPSGIAIRTPSYLGNLNTDIFIWGAQLNIGYLQPYQFTNNLLINY